MTRDDCHEGDSDLLCRDQGPRGHTLDQADDGDPADVSHELTSLSNVTNVTNNVTQWLRSSQRRILN